MTNLGANYPHRQFELLKSDQKTTLNTGNHRQLTNCLIDPNIDLPLITEEKVEEVFDSFKKSNYSCIPAREPDSRNCFLTQTLNGSKVPAKIIKLPSAPRNKLIKVSLSQDGEKEREENLNLRKANRDKIFRKPSSNDASNSSKYDESNSRCLLKCPHQSCGLRYQLHALIRHLMVYHEDSIEEIPGMLNLSSEDLKSYLNNNQTSESSLRLKNISLRRSFNSIHSLNNNSKPVNFLNSLDYSSSSSVLNGFTIPNKTKFLKNGITVHQKVPLRKSLNSIRQTYSEQDENENNNYKFIDDSAISSKPKFHVITLPRRSLNKKPDVQCQSSSSQLLKRGQSMNHRTTIDSIGYPLRSIKKPITGNRETNPISSSLSSLTLATSTTKQNIPGIYPTIYKASSFSNQQKLNQPVLINSKHIGTKSIRISSPDDYVPVGKTTFRSSTNLITKTPSGLTGDFVYPPVGLLISANQDQVDFNNDKTLVNSNNLDQKEIHNLLKSIQSSSGDSGGLEGQIIDSLIPPLSINSDNSSNYTDECFASDENQSRRRSLSATITDQDLANNFSQSPISSQQFWHYPDSLEITSSQKDGTDSFDSYSYSVGMEKRRQTLPSTSISGYFRPHEDIQSNPKKKLVQIRPSSVFSQTTDTGLPCQFRAKATPNVRLVYECPIRDCTAVFPSEPAFQRHFDSVHDKAASGGLIIAQPSGYYEGNKPGNIASGQNINGGYLANPRQSICSPGINELSFIDSLDLFMPSNGGNQPQHQLQSRLYYPQVMSNGVESFMNPTRKDICSSENTSTTTSSGLLCPSSGGEHSNEIYPLSNHQSVLYAPNNNMDHLMNTTPTNTPNSCSDLNPNNMETNHVNLVKTYQCTPTNEKSDFIHKSSMGQESAINLWNDSPNNDQMVINSNDQQKVPYNGDFSSHRQNDVSSSVYLPISQQAGGGTVVTPPILHSTTNVTNSEPLTVLNNGLLPATQQIQPTPTQRPRTKYNSGHLNYEHILPNCGYLRMSNEFPSMHNNTRTLPGTMSRYGSRYSTSRYERSASATTQFSSEGPSSSLPIYTTGNNNNNNNESDCLSHTSSIDMNEAYIDIETIPPPTSSLSSSSSLDNNNKAVVHTVPMQFSPRNNNSTRFMNDNNTNQLNYSHTFNIDHLFNSHHQQNHHISMNKHHHKQQQHHRLEEEEQQQQLEESSTVEDNEMDILNKIIDEYSLFQFQGGQSVKLTSCMKPYECPDTWQFKTSPSSNQESTTVDMDLTPSGDAIDSDHTHTNIMTTNLNDTCQKMPFVGGGLLSSLSVIAVSSNECIRTSNRANQLLSDIIRRRREVLWERQLGQQKEEAHGDDQFSDIFATNLADGQFVVDRNHKNLFRESSILSMISSTAGGGPDTCSNNNYKSSTCSSTHSRHKRRHSQLSRNTSFICEDLQVTDRSFTDRPTSLDLAIADDFISINNNNINSVSTPSSPSQKSVCKRRSLNSIADYWSGNSKSVKARTHSIGPSCSVDMIRS